MKPRLSAALCALVALGACVPSGPTNPGPAADANTSWTIESGGRERSYLLRLPTELDSIEGHPLLVMLHGAGSNGAEMARWVDSGSAATDAGFITVYPDGYDESWNIGCPACTSAAMDGVDDISFVNELIDDLVDSLPVRENELYLVGHSLGAQFVHYYACQSPRVPRGIAAFSGLWLRRVAVPCPSDRDVAVMMVHGDRDRILPWEGPRENISALSMPEAWERWYDLLGCREEPTTVEEEDAAGDGTRVTTTTVDGCRSGTAIELHRLRGAGHAWPGARSVGGALGPETGNFDGMSEVLRFLTTPRGHRTGGME